MRVMLPILGVLMVVAIVLGVWLDVPPTYAFLGILFVLALARIVAQLVTPSKRG